MDIKFAESEIKRWESIKAILLRSEIEESDDVISRIFKLYLRLESVTNVAKVINDMGFRTKGSTDLGRKYIPKDISDIITDKKIIIEDIELQKLVVSLFQNHKIYSLKCWS